MPRTERPNADRPTLEALRARMIELGETPSGCWEDEDAVFSFSARGCGPATYGHPAVTLSWRSGFYVESIAPRTGDRRDLW